MSAVGLLASAIVLLLAVPYLLPSRSLSPVSGIVLWSSVLFMRAVLAVFLAVVVVFFIPATQLFSLLTHWCLHAVVPFFATHLGFDGHSLGDAAVVVPAVVTAASLLSVGFGAWRGARTVRRWLKRSSLGTGPGSSVIVGGSEVVLLAAGIRSPRVVVSAGALVRLDDAELAAGLEHEWGHVVRRHRLVALLGQACRALSHLLPGGKRALEQLQLHLERDADDYAVRRTGDPIALASAICKAAGASGRSATPAFTGLDGDAVTARLRRLTGEGPEAKPVLRLLPRSLAAILLAGTLALTSSAAALASTDPHARHEAQPAHTVDC